MSCLIFAFILKIILRMIIKYLLSLFFVLFISACSTSSSQKNKVVVFKEAGVGELSDFEKNFVSNFQSGSLPYSTQNKIKINDTIASEKVIKYIFEPAERANSTLFRDYWGDDEINQITKKGLEDRFLNVDNNVFSVINFGYVNRIELNDQFYSLIVRCVPTFLEGAYAYDYLIHYSKEGEFIDALKIGVIAAYADMESYRKSQITSSGTIDIQEKTIRRDPAATEKNEFIETSTKRISPDKKGNFQLINENYSAFSGNFISEKSQQMFLIYEHPNTVEAYFQDLKSGMEGAAMVVLNVEAVNKAKNEIKLSNPESNESYVLLYDKNKSSFHLKDTKGAVQSFQRSDRF